MKKKLYLSAFMGMALGLPLSSSQAQEQACGEVSIAAMTWQSGEIMAALDKFVLEKGYGCTVETVVGDTVMIITSMVEKSRPDIAPEGWVSLQPELVNNGVAEGKLVIGADIFLDGAVQGWFIPKYIAEAHPDIKTIDDALKHPEIFPNPDEPAKGAIINGAQGWGGTVVTTQFFKAYEAQKAGFDLIDPGSSAGLDGSLIKAYERGEGWLGYYWLPTSMLGKYEMVKLDHGVELDVAEWDRCNTVLECPDPKRNGWPVDKVQTLMTKNFASRATPQVLSYLQNRALKNEALNKLMAWATDNQADGEAATRTFLQENEAIWQQWVTPEAAAKIKAAL